MNLLLDWKLNKNYSPDSAAIINSDSTITYSQLDRLSVSRAGYLYSKGIKANNLVMMLSDNNSDFIVNVFALWLLNAIPIPVNVRLNPAEIERLIDFTGCSSVLINSFLQHNLNFKNAKVIYDGSAEEKEDSLQKGFPSADKTAVIIFTSGSSGKPKGVELTFDNLIQSALTADSFLNHSDSERWLASLPFYHIGGFSIISRAVLSGASIILPASLSTEDLCSSIRDNHPTLASFVSIQLKRLIDSGCKPNKELRNVLLGGGFIDKELIKDALNQGWNVSKVYGSSETASFVTALNCKTKHKLDSAGMGLSPNEIFIVDKNKNILPPNTSGEIVIKSAAAAKGYLNNQEDTSEKFKDGFYYSGDIGYLDEEGYLFIEARRTDLIISGGENVYPAEVESVLLQYPGIAEAAVFGIEDKEWGQAVSAAIVTANKVQISHEKLINFLKDKIAGYKIPKKIFNVDEIPKTPLGKIQIEKLREMLNDRIE